MPFLYRLQSQQSLSIKQLQYALQLIVTKHLSIRTALIFNKQNNQLIQHVVDFDSSAKQCFTFIQSIFETDDQLIQLMHDEKRNSHLFDLAEGLVFRCHIVHYQRISSTDTISDKDVIIFNFHHALFDYPSMGIFLNDLNQAYTTGQLLSHDATALRYLDCKFQLCSI